MSVHTQLTEKEIISFVNTYNLGELQEYASIGAGVTNTIYYFTTPDGEFILTLLEELTTQELPFYVNLMNFLHENNIPCQEVQNNLEGSAINTLKNKPAIIVNYLPGEPIQNVENFHCEQVGNLLGKIHQVAQAYTASQQNSRDDTWRMKTLSTLESTAPMEDYQLLKDEVHFHQKNNLRDLPQGIIHADLFRDNVLFNQNTLCGVIDFYYACNGALLLDLAIAINDWCVDSNYQIDQEKQSLLLEAYEKHRKLTEAEKEHWTIALRLGALRFWLSRLHDYYFVPRNEKVLIKDPDYFKNLLCNLR